MEPSSLLALLPATLDLEASARSSGALRRRRGVRDAASLLRLTLGYAVCGLSLRGAAAWAEVGALARLSNVALLNRLRGAADWLGQIVGAILSARLSGSAGAGGERRWRLVDATTLSCPGSRKTDWRVHVGCRLGAQPRIEQLELSDGRGSESLGRFACGPGDIEIGDRGYAKAGDLADVAARGADFIVRTGWNSVRLRHADGAPFDLFAALDAVPEQGTADLSLTISRDRAQTQLLPVRLVARRLSAAEAERSRRRASRKSRKQGKTLQPQTLRAAGYVLLLTSLDAASFTAADILALYRLRWQIELLFKRLKSLLHLDQLPAKDPDLARCWIYAKLIAALLLEEMTGLFLDSPPCADRSPAANDLALARPAHAA
ncbi:MAG: IS4 family transposase [Proteobacteria bacterium]|nr:IS4 family transposase [Pseudomonadota bacterium]